MDASEPAVTEVGSGRWDSVLFAGRQGRWRWPWAAVGTVVAAGVCLLAGLGLANFDDWLSAAYGGSVDGGDLVAGRLDTYVGFLTFAITLLIGPALALQFVHRQSPRDALGLVRRFEWPLFWRTASAFLLVMVVSLLFDLWREPQNFRWQPRPASHPAWLLLAAFVIFFQSFAEGYLFKGYLVRVWGAVFPLRWPMIGAIAALFTGAHTGDDDVSRDLVFNIVVFYVYELLAFWVFLRTQSLAATTGLHWINNVWAFCIVATQPGQSGALTYVVYTDPVLEAGGSHLLDALSWAQVGTGLVVLCTLLIWRRSPFALPPVTTVSRPAVPVSSPMVIASDANVPL